MNPKDLIVNAQTVAAEMDMAKNTPIVTQKDINDNYYFDEIGTAYKRCPLAVRKKRQIAQGVDTTIDEEKTPCYYLFSSMGHPPTMVTKSGVETRDKVVWFLSEQEALESKSKALSEKRRGLENKLKEAEKAKKAEKSKE